jgi:hypothetical protein
LLEVVALLLLLLLLHGHHVALVWEALLAVWVLYLSWQYQEDLKITSYSIHLNNLAPAF